MNALLCENCMRASSCFQSLLKVRNIVEWRLVAFCRRMARGDISFTVFVHSLGHAFNEINEVQNHVSQGTKFCKLIEISADISEL